MALLAVTEVPTPRVGQVFFSSDVASYAYSYVASSADLYVVDGLR